MNGVGWMAQTIKNYCMTDGLKQVTWGQDFDSDGGVSVVHQFSNGLIAKPPMTEKYWESVYSITRSFSDKNRCIFTVTVLSSISDVQCFTR